MRRALITVNPYSVLPSGQNQSIRLKTELGLLGVQAEIRKNAQNFFIRQDGSLGGGLGGYDFCVYLDKDKYSAHMLEATGLRLFNSARSVEICDDKMSTHIALAGKGIPMPETVAGLLCYTPEAAIDESALESIERRLGYPVIVKESYGSLGRGVYKADNRKQLALLYEKLRLVPHLYQRFIKNSAGRDIRVIVTGGRCIAAMLRKSNGDFRSNIELGGKGVLYEIDAELDGLCVRTAEILGLDYCGIDVLFGDNGYTVCEVNSNAFFGEMERVSGVNVARAYAEHIIKEIY